MPQVVLEMRNWLNYGCARAPASLCAILEENQDEKNLVVTALDPLRGRGKVLRTIQKEPRAHLTGAALSPDGTTFAISSSDEAGLTFARFHSRVPPTAKSLSRVGRT